MGMATFKPPVDALVAWAEPGETGVFRAMARGARGRNVFKLTDGSFSEEQPYPDSLIEHIYHGGHIHEITAQEQADLIAAGYGNYIT